MEVEGVALLRSSVPIVSFVHSVVSVVVLFLDL